MIRRHAVFWRRASGRQSWPIYRWKFSFKPFLRRHRFTEAPSIPNLPSILCIINTNYSLGPVEQTSPKQASRELRFHFPSPGRHLQRMLDENLFFLAFLGVFWIQLIWTSNFGFVLNFSFSDHHYYCSKQIKEDCGKIKSVLFNKDYPINNTFVEGNRLCK